METNLGKFKDDYVIINDEKVLHSYLETCKKNKYISIDTETTGLDPLLDELVGVCIYTRGQKGAYIPINHVSYITGVKSEGQLPNEIVMGEFDKLLKSKPYIDMFNSKFDIRVLRNAGLKSIYCTWDGYLAARLLNENEGDGNNGLKQLHKKYCLDGVGDAFSFDELFRDITFDKIPISVGYLYAAHDPVITTELCDYQRQFLREDSDREDLRSVYWVMTNIEMPCVSVVADMEDIGVELDMKYQEKLSKKYNDLLAAKEKEVYAAIRLYDKEISAYRAKHTSFSSSSLSSGVNGSTSSK